MSTILYDNKKFTQIRESLRIKQDEINYLWGHRCTDNTIEVIDKFVQDLRVANTRAYNIRYDEDVPIEILPDRSFHPLSTIPLIKSLQSVRCNIDDESVNNCSEILTNLIYHLMDDVISDMPEYQKANVWD